MTETDPEVQIQSFLPVPTRVLLAILAILLGSAILMSLV